MLEANKYEGTPPFQVYINVVKMYNVSEEYDDINTAAFICPDPLCMFVTLPFCVGARLICLE